VRCLAILTFLSFISCAHAPLNTVISHDCKDPIQSPGLSGRLSDDTVIARWNGGELKYQSINEALTPRFRQMKNAYLSEVHSIELDVLNARVAKALIKQESTRRGISEEAYMSSVAESSKKVEDADVQEFYDANRSRINESFEKVAGEIRSYLEKENKKDLVRSEIEKLYENAEVELLLPQPKLIPNSFQLEGRPRKGPADAALTIVEFSDFECPYCRLSASDIERRLSSREDKVAVVFLHYPLSFHKNAKPAAVASECAHRQQAFWPFHDAVFAAQDDLSEALYLEIAKQLKLDLGQFTKCLIDPKAREAVEADMKQGVNAGVKGTPSLFLNGIPATRGVPSGAEIDAIINARPAS